MSDDSPHSHFVSVLFPSSGATGSRAPSGSAVRGPDAAGALPAAGVDHHGSRPV